jgi:hypothetical protein
MVSYNGIITLNVSWSSLKSIARSKNLSIQYEQTENAYEIFCLDGNVCYKAIIFKFSVPDTINFNQSTNDEDKFDFETNYKDIITNKKISANYTIATYSAVALNFAPPTTPTDIFTISGSDSKIVYVNRIVITGTQNYGAFRDILFIKRSTKNTGGAFTILKSIPYDSISPNATAEVRAYTANPILGTAIGTIFAAKVFIPSNNALASQNDKYINFGINNGKPIILRGTSELLAVNLNSITSPGNLISISIEWTEE